MIAKLSLFSLTAFGAAVAFAGAAASLVYNEIPFFSCLHAGIFFSVVAALLWGADT